MQEVEADILKTTLKVFKKRLNANENKMGGNGKRSSLKKLHKYLREKTSTKESVQVGKPLMLRRQPIIMASVISLAIKTKHWKREACL